MDLKHATDLEAPPDVPVWDDLPHPPARPVAPSTPARPAGPCLSDSDLCTTDSCSSLGPEQPLPAAAQPLPPPLRTHDRQPAAA